MLSNANVSLQIVFTGFGPEPVRKHQSLAVVRANQHGEQRFVAAFQDHVRPEAIGLAAYI